MASSLESEWSRDHVLPVINVKVAIRFQAIQVGQPEEARRIVGHVGLDESKIALGIELDPVALSPINRVGEPFTSQAIRPVTESARTDEIPKLGLADRPIDASVTEPEDQ